MGGNAYGGNALSAPVSANNHVFVHLYSGDSDGLGMENLAEFGVSARMDNCLAKSCELSEPCILGVIKYFKTYMLLSFYSLYYNL